MQNLVFGTHRTSGGQLIAALKAALGSPQFEFHAGVSYRNILVYRGDLPAPFSNDTKTQPPHDIPDRPIAAFTASATRQVRHDILSQLQLRNADKYIASFHRANLRYLVRQCDANDQPSLLITALRQYADSSVIVYAPTISKVEETVDFLEGQGIAAAPYHGKMENAERRRNQERWMSDEVRVLVGTIAFGLGINKATVRAVIHLALPKSIEQYYQEAGRAGRDGEPADCVLLWKKQDAGLLGYFANQIIDSAERDRAWQRYHIIRAFVESNQCRHRQICERFAKGPSWMLKRTSS